MGLDFRRSLIAELERRQLEIDSMLTLLRNLHLSDINLGDLKMTSMPMLQPRVLQRLEAPAKGSELYEEIFELRQQGLSLRAIAEQVHLSHAGVWKVLRRYKHGKIAQSEAEMDGPAPRAEEMVT